MAGEPRTVDSFTPSCDKQDGENVQTLYAYGVGIDCHSRFIQVCVLCNKGTEVIRFEKDFATGWDQLRAAKLWILDMLAANLPAATPSPADRLEYTLESTGCYHLPVVRALGGVPHIVNPLLANPNRRKTDVLDARMLAHHAICGLWPASFLPPDEVQELRVVWAQRNEAKRLSTRCINRSNNLILRWGHTFGATIAPSSTLGIAALEDLAAGKLPGLQGVSDTPLPLGARAVLTTLLATRRSLVAESQRFEQLAVSLAKSLECTIRGGELRKGSEVLTLLQTVPGIGPVTAMLWLVEIVEPTRFPCGKAVAAFAGCDPTLKVSAGKVTSTVRRKGNARLHTALMQAAGSLITRNKESIGRWGYQIWKRKKKGGFKTACGAVARRLAIAMWHVHSKCEPFSYQGYNFWRQPSLPDVSLSEMGLSPYVFRKFQELGLVTSQRVVDAFNSSLASTPGVGQQCLLEVSLWLQTQMERQNQGQSQVLSQASGVETQGNKGSTSSALS